MINIATNVAPSLSLGSTSPDTLGQQSQSTTNYGVNNAQPTSYSGSDYQVNNFEQNNTMYQNQGYVQQPVPMAQPVAPVPQAQPVGQVARPQGKGVSLAKGQKVSLSKMNPNLDEIFVGLGWDVANTGVYDLDSEAFLLGANDKVLGDDWFVFYGQPASPDGSVIHCGDNRTGAGSGDDEIIKIKLSQVNPNVAKILFIVSIDRALELGLNFGQVSNAYIRVVDSKTNTELVKFNLTDYYTNVTSMMVGELYKKGGEWRFNPIGNGVAEDLAGLCTRYGVNLA